MSDSPPPHDNARLTWEADVSLLGNALVAGQVALVLVLSTACVAAFVLGLTALEGGLDGQALRQIGGGMLLILAGLLLLAGLAMLLFYGGRYRYRFVLDDAGVTATVAGRTHRTNAIVNGLLALSGPPAAMGAGMLAARRQSESIRWGSVSRLSADPRRHSVILYSGRRPAMLVQCSAANYKQVVAAAQQALAARRSNEPLPSETAPRRHDGV